MSKKKSTDSDTDTTSSSTPYDTPSNINPKIYARIVSDLSSDDDMLFYPDATVSSFNNQYATSMPSLPHTTPIGNSKPSAMFVTPEQCAKPTLPSGQYISRIAAPVVPESISSTYFDCLDFDLTKEESEERAHLASFGELPSIFDQDMKREEEVPPSSGCSTSSEEIEGMCNMTDAGICHSCLLRTRSSSTRRRNRFTTLLIRYLHWMTIFTLPFQQQHEDDISCLYV